MDEKVLEEINFHQEVIARDVNSPLHLIREKEMEISGRVLAAKNEAERIVAEARRKANETLRAAESEADRLAKEADAKVLAEAKADAESLRAGIVDEVRDLETRVAERMEPAVAEVVRMVTTV